MNNSQKKGFTLIELLVVIAIIGILSTIGLVALNGSRVRARDAKRVADLRQYALIYATHADTNATNTYVTGCAHATRASQCAALRTAGTGSATGILPRDPSSTTAGAPTAASCSGIGVAACRTATNWSTTAVSDYTIAQETASQWALFNVLEQGSGGISAGRIVYTEAGSFSED